MNYHEAKKKVDAQKRKEDYFVFTFGYDTRIVLPHKVGIAFLETLNGAEQLTDPYSGTGKIIPIESEKYQIRTMSSLEYERYKIAALLGVSYKDVQQIEEEATAST